MISNYADFMAEAKRLDPESFAKTEQEANDIKAKDRRIAELEAELRAANRECEVRNERELGYLARAQSAEAESDALKTALEVAFDYAMQNISEERQRFAGYKPELHAQWAKDEALMRAALAAKGE